MKSKLGNGRCIEAMSDSLGPENVRHYHRGVTESNAVEFDNRWNDLTQKVGYKSTLGNQGLRLLESNHFPQIQGNIQPSYSQQNQRDHYAESRGLAAPSQNYNNSSNLEPVRITSDPKVGGSRYGGDRRY